MSTPKIPGLTKSKVLTGLQCEKALYLTIHEPKLASPVDASQQALFDQGNLVGVEAQKQFPGGVLIDVPRWELTKAIQLTADAIKGGANTIYEGTFSHNGVLVRVDILHRKSAKKPWHIVEVKSSTAPRDEHLMDLAIQSWVLTGAGIEHDKAKLMHVNNQCAFPDLADLFTIQDCTDDIEPLLKDVPKRVKALQKIVSADKPPVTDIGPHCSSPYDCGFQAHCWKAKKIPEVSVLDLPGSAAKKWALYDQGILRLDDPRIELDDYTGTQRKMLDAALTGKRWIDKKGLARFSKELEWPLYFLDFETIGYAIPRYDGTRPYQQVPFQFSVHVQAKKGEKLDHGEFLHADSSDPRKDLVDALLKACGTKGSVISYNKGFEEGRIKELAKTFPRQSKSLLALCERLVDPLPTFRAHVYDPGFLGSFSIKAVAPALIGDRFSYEGMVIGDGGAAGLGFQEMIAEDTSAKRKTELRKALLAYCEQDTVAMVELVNWMLEQVREEVAETV